MEDRKDIGKAFKDRLDGLQKSPGDAVWQSLSTDLDKRRKRKLTSFWFRFLGIAFIVLISISIITLIMREDKAIPPAIQNAATKNTVSPSNNNQGTNAGTPTSANEKTIVNNDIDKNSSPDNNSNNNTIARTNSNKTKGHLNSGSDNNSNKANSNNRKGNHSTKNANSNAGNDTGITNTDNMTNNSSTGKGKNTDRNNGDNPVKTNTKKSGYAKNTGPLKNANTNSNLNPTTTYNNQPGRTEGRKKSSIASSTAENDRNSSDAAKKYEENARSTSAQNTIGQEKTANNRLAEGSTQPLSDNNDKSVDGDNNTANNDSLNNSSGTSTLSGKKASDVISMTTAADKVSISGTDIMTKNIGTVGGPLAGNDTIKPADSLKIEKPIAEEEKKPEEKKKTDSIHPPDFRKWYFAVNAGPSKYTFPSNKSIIDSRLDDNAADIKSTFNYGAYIGYRFNTKWGVRLGINSTKFEQVTKNAYLLNEEQQAEDFEHINYAATQATPDPPPNPGDPPPVFSQGNEAIIEKLGAYADIMVKITYIEIPAEVTFHAFGNRIGADITGGFSTLFINKNAVTASNDFGSVYMGTLDSKKMSFSTNLGFRFYYQFIPSLQLNIEPAFRYYLNTFDNVKPYSLNLQAGLQYNFNMGKKKQ